VRMRPQAGPAAEVKIGVDVHGQQAQPAKGFGRLSELMGMLAVVIQAGSGSPAAQPVSPACVMVCAWMRACGMPTTGWV